MLRLIAVTTDAISTAIDEPRGTSVDATAPDTIAGTLASTNRGEPAAEAVVRGSGIGRYLVLDQLGRGTMGSVFSAYDADLDRKVAIKLIAEPLGADLDRRQRLLGEAQLMAKISHPNVVTVFDVGVWRDRVYVAMELIEGVTLDRWCAASVRSIDAILGVFCAAAEGLAAAHDAGVVHRDFKPTNVIVGDDGQVRVADFGIALRTDRLDTDVTATTVPSSLQGTPAYMSPEQWMKRAVDARSDQFSYSVALFEALFGRRPFAGTTLTELGAAVAMGRMVEYDPVRIGARVRAVLMRGLAVRPEDRFASMRAMNDAMNRARRPRWAPRTAAGAAVVLGAFSVWMFNRSPAAVDACDSGKTRIEAVWPVDVREAIDVDRTEVASAYADAQRQHLRESLDDYAARWALLHDDACRLRASRDTDDAGERSRESCVEDRLAALSGTIAALHAESIPATSVVSTLETLPDLDGCRVDKPADWEPVPSDPHEAQLAAALRERIVATRIHRKRLDDGATRLPEVESIARDAVALGFPHLIVQAKAELGASYDSAGRRSDAARELQEALVIAVTHDFDALAGRVVNGIILVSKGGSVDPEDLRRWVALGEAFATRGDDRRGLRGDLQNNLCLALRSAADPLGALEACRRAEAAYTQDRGADSLAVLRARINQVSALLDADRAVEALELAQSTLRILDELQDPVESDNIAALEHLAAAQHAVGVRRAALESFEGAWRRRLVITGGQGPTAFRTLQNLVVLRALVGELAAADEGLRRLRELDSSNGLRLAIVESLVAANGDDTVRATALLDAVVARAPARGRDSEHARFTLALLAAANGRPAHALTVLESVCGSEPPVAPMNVSICRGIAVATAAIANDRQAMLLWLARFEASFPMDPDADELGLATCAHAALLDHWSEGVETSAREAVERMSRDTHERAPLSRVLSTWLRTRVARP